MRISTTQMHAFGLDAMSRQNERLLKTQQQIATGRKLLTPADGPVEAARALEIRQSKAIGEQQRVNQDSARSALGIAETQLAAAENVLTDLRTLAVQGGNGVLGTPERTSIAAEMRSRFQELLGIANATDAAGGYLFSGYQTATRPFASSVGGATTYFGDDGRRLLQVGPSRQLEISDPGSELFMNVRTGNGTFLTQALATNAGGGIIDSGAVTDPSKWASPANSGDLSIRFAVINGATTYDLVDNVSGNSLLTGAPSGAGPYARTYVSGQPINLRAQGAEPPFDFGSAVIINGAPANGDRFDLKSSGTQSVFDTLSQIILALERGPAGGASGNAPLMNAIGAGLANLDQALSRAMDTRARIGARMNELDSLTDSNGASDIQYAQTLSKLEDLDLTEAISRLTLQQTGLEAAQKSFVRIANLSLFNYV